MSNWCLGYRFSTGESNDVFFVRCTSNNLGLCRLWLSLAKVGNDSAFGYSPPNRLLDSSGSTKLGRPINCAGRALEEPPLECCSLFRNWIENLNALCKRIRRRQHYSHWHLLCAHSVVLFLLLYLTASLDLRRIENKNIIIYWSLQSWESRNGFPRTGWAMRREFVPSVSAAGMLRIERKWIRARKGRSDAVNCVQFIFVAR